MFTLNTANYLESHAIINQGEILKGMQLQNGGYLTLALLLKLSSYCEILRSNKYKEFQTKWIIYILKQSLSTSEKLTFQNDAKHCSAFTTTTTLGFVSHDLKMASWNFFFYRKSCKTKQHLIGGMWNVKSYRIWKLILQYNVRYLTWAILMVPQER